MNEVIKVKFEAEEFTKYVSGLTQWNYGAFLEVAGLNIPDGSVEVHFSLKEMTGNAPRYIGIVKDGIMTCAIPSFITLCDTVYDYNGYAFIYLTDADSGTTEKKIVFNIMARPKPEDFIPPEEPGIVGQLLELIDNKVDKVDGKELSSNDYTDEEKNKLAALPTNDELTANIGDVKSDLQKEIKDTADNLTSNMQGMIAEQDEEIDKVYRQLSDQISNVNSSLSNLIEETNTNAVEKIEELGSETDAKISETAETLKEEINDANKSANETFANSVKGKASGEVIRVDDVSPVEHTARAKVSGKNLFNIGKGLNEYLVKNDDGTYTITRGANRFSNYIPLPVLANTPIAISCVGMLADGFRAVTILFRFVDDSTAYVNMTNEINVYARTFEKDLRDAQIYLLPDALVGNYKTFSGIQVEYGDTATEYEPYIDPTTIKVTRYGKDETDNPETYTPDASGNVDIPSLSPTMTIITDTAGAKIDLEYNQDTNKAMGNIKSDLRELEDDVAEIISSGGGSSESYYTKEEIDAMIGDIDAALDELHNYAQSIVNGGAE